MIDLFKEIIGLLRDNGFLIVAAAAFLVTAFLAIRNTFISEISRDKEITVSLVDITNVLGCLKNISNNIFEKLKEVDSKVDKATDEIRNLKQ